jgi:hypothetical protein
MSIKFVCSCGKRLRARDEMAARRSVCPRCGSPVGIPSLKPTHPGTAPNPMLPSERLARQKGAIPPRPAAPFSQVLQAKNLPGAPEHTREPGETVDTGFVKQILEQEHSPSRLRRYGTHASWLGSFLYALRAAPRIFILAFVMTVVVGLGFKMLQEAKRFDSPFNRYEDVGPYLVAIFIGLPFAYSCAFLDAILRCTASRDLHQIPWPGRDFNAVLKTSLTWLCAFLAGPVVPAGLVLTYWLQCGEPELLDWIILGELGIAAVSYWLIVLVVLHKGNRLRDLNPIHVADMTYAFGPLYFLQVCLSAAVLCSFVALAVAGIELMPKNNGQALTMLVCACGGGIFGATWFLRLLGMKARMIEVQKAEEVDESEIQE